MLEALIVVALLVTSCTGEIMENSFSKKTELPWLWLNSVGESSDMSNSHSPENKRKKGRKRRIETKESAKEREGEEEGGGGSHRLQATANWIRPRGWWREHKEDYEGRNVTSCCQVNSQLDGGAGGTAASLKRRAQRQSLHRSVTNSTSEFSMYLRSPLHAPAIMSPSHWLLESMFCSLFLVCSFVNILLVIYTVILCILPGRKGRC